MQKIFLYTHTHTLCTFPSFTRAFQWANAFGNEPKQEPGTDSWVLTPIPVRAEQCCCHRKQRALVSEVKPRAHAAKVKLKELHYLSTGVLKQGASRSKPPFATKNIPFQCLTCTPWTKPHHFSESATMWNNEWATQKAQHALSSSVTGLLGYLNSPHFIFSICNE